MSTTANPNAGIAIVGMDGLFPKARTLDEFWRNLCEGVDGISFFSDEELAAAGAAAPQDLANYVKARGVLEDADLFDAAFFGMLPKEAELTDPQHRLFLECAWRALENAGCDPHRPGGAIGVFAGLSTNTYLTHNLAIDPQILIGIGADFQTMVGNEKDYLPTRVSYKLNLHGPSLNIQTACSTSLVAVCVACQHLLTYQCDVALAGAVSVSFPQKRGYVYLEGGIESPDGHCRPFDAKSAGTVAGEGIGVVALKRMEDALADGDAIYAVIKGFGMNNDGGTKIGYTAPSVQGQAEVIAMAQAMAGFEPQTIGYVEAHGTGTPLGDPIEIEGLNRAFRLGTDAKNFCALGSVKSNIGHLDTAAGIAGLIKAALALHHKKIPPSLHFESPNPKINFADSPFYVNAALSEWDGSGGPRRAGVSSFGIGGTNAHVVLEEAPVIDPSTASRAAQLFLLTAKTKTALDAATKNLAAHLQDHPQLHPADVASTLQTGRREFNHRAMLVCRDTADAAGALASADAKRILTGSPHRENPPVVFMFPGQGAQRVNMGRQLYETEPAFRETVDLCCGMLEPHLGFDLRTVLYPKPEDVETATARLVQTAITQPAMFVVEYALARLWMNWGVQPEAMIGHSIGEYVAACVAGVFSLSDALRLVAVRGRMMQELPGGTMLAVRLPEAEVTSLLNESLSLAVVNGASACVVSGSGAAVEALQQQLAGRGVACAPLHTSHAFHSAMMDSILPAFTALVESIERHAPQIPFISNVTGTWITDEEATDPGYWATHLRRTVRFADGLSELFQSERVFLEVGPGQTLTGLARQHPGRSATVPVITSLPQAREGSSEVENMLSALGQLWLNGVSPDWKQFYAQEKRRRVWLPTYPFERKRHWVQRRRAKVESNGNPAVETGTRGAGVPPASACVLPAAGGTPALHPSRESQTRRRLQTLMASQSGLDAGALDGAVPFMQMGFDSLFLTQISVAVERDFGVRVAFRQLLEEFPTLDSLAAHIDLALQPDRPRASDSPGTSEPKAAEAAHASATPHDTGLKPGANDIAKGDVVTAPLTESQWEIWFASQLSEAASCVYNQCHLLHLRGGLQPAALRIALQRLVDRHEALRTTFPPGGKEQRIERRLTMDVPFADWSHLQAAECAQNLDAAQLDEARQAFDLVAGPVIRARLIRMSESHHVFVVTVHHLVCDGYSFGILLRELGELYSAECRGVSATLPPALQFSEYARTQAQREQSPAHAVDAQYWVDQFATDAPVLELPTDHPRSPEWKFDGAREDRTLPQKLSEDLRRLSAQHGCTLFTTLFAAHTLLLRRLSGQKEIVVGVPLADRAIAGGESLVGHCVNFLPLRGSIEDGRTFPEHLIVMQKVFLDADEHGRYAFGSLIQKLNLARQPGRMPLVSTTFNLERRSEELQFAGVAIELAGNAHSAGSFDFNFDVTDAPGGVQLDVRYNTSLFAAATIQRWLGHFQTLLEGIVAEPQRPIGDLPVLSPAEERQILIEWNETRAEFASGKCLHHLFEEQVGRTPDAVAAVFHDDSLTYRELNADADQLARQLIQSGVGPDVPVGICVERSLEMLVGVLAVLKAGGACVPLDPAYPKERLRLVLGNARALVLLTQPHLAADWAESQARVICLERPGRERRFVRTEITPTVSVTPEHLAYVLHTSGSTGVPKGVAMPHRALVNLICWQLKETKHARGSRTLQYASLSFDVSFQEMFSTWCSGGTLVLIDEDLRRDAVGLLRFLGAQKVERLFLPFVALQQLAEASGDEVTPPSSLREVITAGEALQITPKVRRFFERRPGCALHNHYGPTESHVVTAFTLAGTPGAWPVLPPIGRPIANTQIYLLDACGQPVPIGVPGELCIGGAGLARGYLHQPERTAERFMPDPFSAEPGARLYRTGDLARWLPDGNLEFLGRSDHQVKIRGFRVEPGEIDAALAQHAAVRACVTVARADTSEEKRLVSYIVADPDQASVTAGELRVVLQETLPEYMVPSAFVFLDALPLTPSGKVNRRALPAPDQTRPGRDETHDAPGTATEEALARIWRDLLGLEHVGTQENFFELGGHSLLMTQAISRVRAAFQVELPMQRFFETPTIAALALVVEELLIEEIQELSDEEARLGVGSALGTAEELA